MRVNIRRTILLVLAFWILVTVYVVYRTDILHRNRGPIAFKPFVVDKVIDIEDEGISTSISVKTKVVQTNERTQQSKQWNLKYLRDEFQIQKDRILALIRGLSNSSCQEYASEASRSELYQTTEQKIIDADMKLSHGLDGSDLDTQLQIWEKKKAKILEIVKDAKKAISETECGRLYVKKSRRFILNLPAYGPNNQFLALKECMAMAKFLDRELVVNSFTHHKYLGPSSKRDFNITFDITKLQEWGETIDMVEFREECDGEQVLAYVRIEDGHWKENAANYFRVNNMKQPKRIDPPKKTETAGQYSEPIFRTRDGLRSYFEEYKDTRCLVIGFLFRNLGGELWNQGIEWARFLVHAPSVMQKTSEVQKDLGLAPRSYILLHWRDGEESCHVERPEHHIGFDFCTGAGAYTWAKLDEVIEVLGKVMKETDTDTLYIATDTKREYLLYKIRSKLNLKIASDSKALMNVKDNFVISLVEQELALQAKVFVGSQMSTWTESLSHYWQSAGYPAENHVFFEHLMERYGKTIMRHDVWHWVQDKESESQAEADALLKTFSTVQAKCKSSLSALGDRDGKHWNICDEPIESSKDCIIVSASMDRDNWNFETQLKKFYKHCRVISLQLQERSDKPENVDHYPLKVGEANYESTRTLQGLMDEIKVDHISLLVLDVQQREWVFFEEAVKSSTFSKVDQMLFEMHIYPLWEANKVGNAGETAAKCRMTRETLESLTKAGLALFHFSTIPNETYARTLSHWLKKSLASTT